MNEERVTVFETAVTPPSFGGPKTVIALDRKFNNCGRGRASWREATVRVVREKPTQYTHWFWAPRTAK